MQNKRRGKTIGIHIAHRKLRREPARIDIAPLIDIIFILLIFFAISTTLVLNNMGLKLQLPAAASVTKEKKGIMLVIDEKQNVFIQDKKIEIADLKEIVKTLLKQNPDTQIILQADTNTPYQLIIKTLDSVRLGGCYDIVLEAKKLKNASV